jgi:hypothetical protein
MSRDGKREDFSPQLARLLGERKDGVTGLAPGPGGSLYVAAGKGVLRVATRAASSFAEA